jgi:hypothetical protein
MNTTLINTDQRTRFNASTFLVNNKQLFYKLVDKDQKVEFNNYLSKVITLLKTGAGTETTTKFIKSVKDQEIAPTAAAYYKYLIGTEVLEKAIALEIQLTIINCLDQVVQIVKSNC